MQNYKDVCGNEEKIWFEVFEEEKQTFLQWAKNLGCIWLDGSEIDPQNHTCGLHVSIHNDGRIANVAMFIWNDKRTEKFVKYSFSEYLKGKKVAPKGQWKLEKMTYEKNNLYKSIFI